MPDSERQSDLEGLRAICDAAKLNADRAYRIARSVESEIERSRGMTWPLIAVCCVLAIMAAGGFWVNTVLKTQSAAISRLERGQAVVAGLDRIENSEAAPTPAQDAAPLQPVTEDPSKSTLAPVPEQAPADSTATLDARLELLQKQHEADTRRITSLQSDLARLQRQAAPTARTSLPPRIEPPPANRRDFQILQGKTGEVVPGVLLAIKEIDVENQEVTGWLYLQDEHRFVQLNNHRLFEPVTVRGMYDKQNHEIVLTRVRRTDVQGYVTPPASGSPEGAGA